MMSVQQLTRAIRELYARYCHSSNLTVTRSRTARLALCHLEERTVPAAPASGNLAGLAFIDANRNGVFESREVRLPGVTVTLRGTTDTGNSVAASTKTNSLGRYNFKNLLPGTYRVSGVASGVLGPSFTVSGSGQVKSVSVGRPGSGANGGPNASVNLGFRGLAPRAVSITQFLTNSTVQNFPTRKAGTGTTNVNYRSNFTPEVKTAIANLAVNKGSSPSVIDLAANFTDVDMKNSIVRFITNRTGTGASGNGFIDIELYDRDAPQTVANFFNYILANKYDNTIFHRHEANFVIQGGGYSAGNPTTHINDGTTSSGGTKVNVPLTGFGLVNNEFSATRSNLINTIAMAKLPGFPDSASSEFFINLANNTNLNTDNGGFTVFGKILTVNPGVATTISKIRGMQVKNLGPFSTLPTSNYAGTNFPSDITAANLAVIKDVKVIKRDEFLKYSVVSVANSTPGLVKATVANNKLWLEYGANLTGIATITVKATDRFGASVTDTFTVTVGNAPTAQVTLSPASPKTNDVLTANVTPSDPDGDAVSLSYVWKLNDTVIAGAAGSTLDLSATGNGNKGDKITVVVTPSDGLLTGTAATAEVTIANTLPVVNSIQLSAVTTSSTSVTATVNATDDDSGDTVTLGYSWSINGQTVQGATGATLDLSTLSFSIGDEIEVTVTPSDGPGSAGNPASQSTTVA